MAGGGDAAEECERGVVAEALEFEIGGGPGDVGLGGVFGFAVDDEDLAGGDLLHVLVEGGAGGGELVNAEVGVEGEGRVVEAHVESGVGGDGGLEEAGGAFLVGGGGVEEGRAEALAEGKEGEEENGGEEAGCGLAERLVGQGGEESQA
jgi:hypothetical protein